MCFNPNLYITQENHWDELCNFIINTKNTKQLAFNDDNDDPDTLAKNYIKSCINTIVQENNNLKKEFDSFWKFIRTYANHKHFSFEKDNLIRLLFILDITDINEIQKFCREIIHQNELSAHSLEDYIVLCSLKLHIPYAEYLHLREKYMPDISNMVIATKKLKPGATGHFLDDAIEIIQNLTDLDEYIQTHLTDFAKTRNNPYLYMFDHVSWEVWTKTEWVPFFDVYPEGAPENYKSYSDEDWLDFVNNDAGLDDKTIQNLIIYFYTNNPHDPYVTEQEIEEAKKVRKILKINDYKARLRKKAVNVALKSYYLEMFSICDNGLSEEEINILAGKGSPYSDSFITYQKYRDLFSRQLSVGISQGVFLISFIHKYNPDMEFIESCEDGSFPNYESYNDYESFAKDVCELFNPDISISDQLKFINGLLSVTGFPVLSSNIPFNKLFIDTLTYSMNNLSTHNIETKADFDTNKDFFLRELCFRLKSIARCISND